MMKRNSSFELLRLICMWFIVVGHCILATSKNSYTPLSDVDNISWLIEAFVACAVDIFFLLSGYFLKEKVNLGRLLGLYIRMWIYNLGIYLILYLLGYISLDSKSFIQHLLPFTYKAYWFMQVYLVLALLSPFIYKLLNSLNKKSHLILMSICLIFFCLHQTFIPVANTLDTTQGYGIIWAVVLVIVGNYIRRYGSFINKINKYVFLLAYVLIAIAMFISNVLIVRFDIAQGVTSRGNFYGYNTITCLLESMCLLIFFSKLNINNKLINYLASSSVAIYLISSQGNLLYLLWTDIIVLDTSNIYLYVLLVLVISLLVCLVCILIDKLVCKIIRLSVIEDKFNKRFNDYEI